MLDENQTGILSAEELKVGFALIKERLTEQQITSFLENDSLTGNRFISYYEWLIMTSNRTTITSEIKLKAAFDTLQTDGKIVREGIKDILMGDKE